MWLIWLIWLMGLCFPFLGAAAHPLLPELDSGSSLSSEIGGGWTQLTNQPQSALVELLPDIIMRTTILKSQVVAAKDCSQLFKVAPVVHAVITDTKELMVICDKHFKCLMG